MNCLILGGGVAGCSLAYFLGKKGHEATIIEQHELGGLSRTYYYAGHPYEFGPHVLMWKNDMDDPVTKAIYELTDGELYDVTRRLFSYVEKDQQYYKYPIHFDSIAGMPERGQVYGELKDCGRCADWKLDSEIPYPGSEASFKEYMESRIGPTLYKKIMESYVWKMWGTPGNQLQMSMLLADQLEAKNKGETYDPIKFKDSPLAQGTLCVYPKKGLNVIWERMVLGKKVEKDKVIKVTKKEIRTIYRSAGYYAKDYDIIFNTLAPDKITMGINHLYAIGRMIIPLLLPDLERAFPHNAETFYFPGAEFQTRTTEMKSITRHKSKDTLILIEVPITRGLFPTHVDRHARYNNLLCDSAYPLQHGKAKDTIKECQELFPKNTIHCGRLAEWKYYGMTEVMKSAYDIVENL